MFGVIMGISNNYARRANYNTDSEESYKSSGKSTFCYYENYSPKKSKNYLKKIKNLIKTSKTKQIF